jgi:hypothetical protein
MFQALMRVAYSILVSKFMPEAGHQKKQLPRNAREKNENSDIEEEESVEQFEVGGKRKPKDRGSVELEEICASLDLNQISGLFMLLLSEDYINQNAPEKMKVKDNFVINYLINICHLNAAEFQKVQIVKTIICRIVDFQNIPEEQSAQKLRILKAQLTKNMNLVVSGVPKLKRVIEMIDKRVSELESVVVEGIDDPNGQKEAESDADVLQSILVPSIELQDFFIDNVHEKVNALFDPTGEDVRLTAIGKNKKEDPAR